MHFDLSSEQQLLQTSARKFLARECPVELVRELMETDTGFDETLWRRMADQGWVAVTLPETHGGLGLGLVELAVVAEALGRACVPGPFISTHWAAALIAEAGDDEQRRRHLAPLADGSERATVALLESNGSWDSASVSLEADATDEGYVITGGKHYVMDAAVADHLVVAVRIADSPALVIVPRQAEGVTITPTPGLDATRRLYRVDFENVSVAETSLLARDDVADAALRRSMQVGAVAACADLLGGMEWVLETTVEYAKVRRQFDRPIGAFQAVQHQCADMLLMLESARSATYYAAWTLTERDPAAPRAVSIAKAYCSDAGREVAGRGVQVHGGIGFTWEHDLHLYYRRAKASELMFGDATWHREQIARLVIDSETQST